MEVNEINKIIQDVQLRINEVSEILVDCENCKNQTSKQYLLAIASRLALQLKSESQEQQTK